MNNLNKVLIFKQSVTDTNVISKYQ